MNIIIIPNYGLALICLELMILWFLDIRTGWANRRRSRRLVLVVCTSVLLTMQVGFAYDLQSYYQGKIGLGFSQYERHFVPPGETYQTGQLSNWYTVTNLDVEVWGSDNNVTFYITDENIPQTRYKEGNYSNGALRFVLPYRFSRPLLVANWTANLYNPSQNESVLVYMSIGSDFGWGAAMHTVIFSHQWPLIVVLTLWFYTGVSILHERSCRRAGRVQVSEQPQDGGSSTAQENPEQSQSSSGDVEDTKHG